MDENLSKLREIKDREAWHAAVTEATRVGHDLAIEHHQQGHYLFQLIAYSVELNSTIINDYFLKTSIKKIFDIKISTFFTNYRLVRMLNYQYKTLYKLLLLETSSNWQSWKSKKNCCKLPLSENLTVWQEGRGYTLSIFEHLQHSFFRFFSPSSPLLS